jgi:predicted lipid-binding transport protein (Tim44 family)
MKGLDDLKDAMDAASAYQTALSNLQDGDSAEIRPMISAGLADHMVADLFDNIERAYDELFTLRKEVENLKQVVNNLTREDGEDDIFHNEN